MNPLPHFHPLPEPSCLKRYHRELAQIVAETSWLPHKRTVEAFDGAVFPTVRVRSGQKRFDQLLRENKAVGMYDDNTTPRWALLWAHGKSDSNRSGWTFAHVWPTGDDLDAYTHLANLAMIPEPLASLTDKQGPLTAYLRWHAWDHYGWKPINKPEPQRPEGYEDIRWRYFEPVHNPVQVVLHRLTKLNNQRTNVLVPLMQEQGRMNPVR